LTASLEKFEELGKLYKDAGVKIDILKLGDPKWPDEQIDYAFRAARAIGARGISLEISDESAKRMAPFADKHKMYVSMHNHTQVADKDFSFDKPLSYSPYLMLNLDIGHYVAGLGESPIPVIHKYHDRITHLHLKDRKTPANGADNVPWGQGDTPIAEVLQLLKQEKYPITAMIELEYPIPEDSDVLTEIAKCVGYCREALA
jgi:sugar phosphate isomerase/epimerase